jgi:energy-coupling factor transporter ATP-binding protein EcfA2
MSAIAAAGLGYRYPDAERPALADVDLRVDHGRIVILEGPSGGGKTTLLRLLGGLAPAFHGGEAWGTASVAGLDLRRARPAEVAARVGFLFQDPEAQGVMLEPLRDVAYGMQCRGWGAERILPAARSALDAVGAGHLVGRRLDALSGGERQRVALAAVLAPEPELLLLDEPTSQLDDDAACELVGILRRFADRGLTVVLSEHRRDRVEHLADETLGVVGGRLRAPAAPPAYDAVERRRDPAAAAAAPMLALRDVGVDRDGRAVLRRVSCALAAGGSVALVGPNGSGKSTLLRAIAGLEPVTAGSIRLGHRDLAGAGTPDRVRDVRLVPQDAGRLLLAATVEGEVRHTADLLGLPPDRAERALDDLGLRALRDRAPRDLSVGERERVALAAAIAGDPRILLLDEPTRGMDGTHRRVLARLIRERCARGYATITATHDRAFARASADALWMAHDGTVTAGDEIPAPLLGDPA